MRPGASVAPTAADSSTRSSSAPGSRSPNTQPFAGWPGSGSGHRTGIPRDSRWARVMVAVAAGLGEPWRLNIPVRMAPLGRRRGLVDRAPGHQKIQQVSIKSIYVETSSVVDNQTHHMRFLTMERIALPELQREFWILVSPIYRLVSGSPAPLHAYRLALAQIMGGHSEWTTRVMRFARIAPDIVYAREQSELSYLPRKLCRRIEEFLKRDDASPALVHGNLRELLNETEREFHELSANVPADYPPQVFQANTPFTAYLRISEVVSTVRHRLDYFDRYLHRSFYSLYLASVPRNVVVRLVTTAKHARRLRHLSILAEKEFEDYKLQVLPESKIHERVLRVDSQFFTLGASIKDAASTYTTSFNLSDASTKTHQSHEQLLSEARSLTP